MGKTIAITPSWYWPAGVPRVVGVPPYAVHELAVDRWAGRAPDEVALVDASTRLTRGELAAEVAARAAALAGRDDHTITTSPAAEAAVDLLAALAAGSRVHCGGAGAPGTASGGPWATRAQLAVPGKDGAVWLSQRSLVAGALGIASFHGLRPEGAWVTAFPLSTWHGVYGLIAPLLAGLTVVLAEPGEPALDAVRREGATWLFAGLDDAFDWTREAKREVKALRGVLGSALLTVDGPFDAEARRRVGRLFECPALTVFGTAETGPMFASHASWYLDEAVGIPLTNMHVVPADPRTGTPLATLWEFVESAMVTVSGPSLCVASEATLPWLADGRLMTGVVASSDPNGMVYLLPS